jgi:hypothetical protein
MNTIASTGRCDWFGRAQADISSEIVQPSARAKSIIKHHRGIARAGIQEEHSFSIFVVRGPFGDFRVDHREYAGKSPRSRLRLLPLP